MATERAKMLKEKYDLLLEKNMISIGDIDDLMCAVDKVLQNLKKAEESRNSWKAKYMELKKDGS